MDTNLHECLAVAAGVSPALLLVAIILAVYAACALFLVVVYFAITLADRIDRWRWRRFLKKREAARLSRWSPLTSHQSLLTKFQMRRESAGREAGRGIPTEVDGVCLHSSRRAYFLSGHGRLLLVLTLSAVASCVGGCSCS